MSLRVGDLDRREAERLGRALHVLRVRAGLSREEAGARIGLGAQAWARHERGLLVGIFRPAMQVQLTEAVGQTVDDLRAEAARIEALQADARP